MTTTVLDISKYMAEHEKALDEIHWQEQARRLEAQETHTETYDPMKVLEDSFRHKHKKVAENAVRFGEEIASLFEDQEAHPISYNNNTVTTFKKVMFYRQVENLKRLQVITEATSLYDSRHSLAKTYFFNMTSFYKLKTTFSRHFRLTHTMSTSAFSYHISSPFVEEDEPAAERFDGSKLRIRKRMRMDITGIPKSRIERCLTENYPQFAHYKGIVDRMNVDLPEEERIRWQFSLKTQAKGGRVFLRKVGFRASSPVCSYKEHANRNPFYRGKWRKDYLEAKYGKGYAHYDFNGSIYRLTYNLNHDEPLDFGKDVYGLMYGSGLRSPEDRAAYKRISMRLMFGDFGKLGLQAERHLNRLDGSDYNRERKDEMQEAMARAKLDMFRFLKSSYDSEIFLHESCVYVGMLSRMDYRNVTLVYDSFYGKLPPLESIPALYLESLARYKSNFTLKPRLTYEQLASCHIIDTCGKRKAKQQKATEPKSVMDASDIPTEDDLKRAEAERFRRLDGKLQLSKLMRLSSVGRVSDRDVQRLLDRLGFERLKAPVCATGFSPSNESIAFHRFMCTLTEGKGR